MDWADAACDNSYPYLCEFPSECLQYHTKYDIKQDAYADNSAVKLNTIFVWIKMKLTILFISSDRLNLPKT